MYLKPGCGIGHFFLNQVAAFGKRDLITASSLDLKYQIDALQLCLWKES